ncbi:hypothetical protein FQN60_013168 [Etheostoma spectabile]|uniref:Uncharacterized protein n=1 Tax=Etheostoma spectabile TaxID=54343 RepID=A0A5J5D9U2_9PERO|nr:hypothetical protein FQN60_013168 [Etheostoma spectabile]
MRCEALRQTPMRIQQLAHSLKGLSAEVRGPVQRDDSTQRDKKTEGDGSDNREEIEKKQEGMIAVFPHMDADYFKRSDQSAAQGAVHRLEETYSPPSSLSSPFMDQHMCRQGEEKKGKQGSWVEEARVSTASFGELEVEEEDGEEGGVEEEKATVQRGEKEGEKRGKRAER